MLAIFPKKPPSWSVSQRKYVAWMNAPLPEDYRKVVSDLLRRFNEWAQLDNCDGLILDVGCGSDRIGAMTYGEFFGFDDSQSPNWVGIDPLLGRCTVQAIAENLPFRDRAFEKVLVKTSLDHSRDFLTAFNEMIRVGMELDLWFSDIRDPSDHTHSFRVSLEAIQQFPFKVEFFKEPFRGSPVADTIFARVIP